MADYHVGCGIFGIYAGVLKKNGEEWLNKSEVTHEALGAAAQYLFTAEKEFRFKIGEQWYAIRVEKEPE